MFEESLTVKSIVEPAQGLLALSVIATFLAFSPGDQNHAWELAQERKRIEQHQRYAQYFGFTDPMMELQYNGSFHCGDNCHGISCMNLSPAELRLRQHKFKPGEDWIGSSKI